MSVIDQIIRLAREQVGYLEKASPSDLDSMTANAGTANYTKYARDVDATDLLNGKKQGYPWCTVFFIWLLLKSCGAELTRRLLYLPEKSLAAGCKFAVEYYKAAGAYGTEPQPGAQIFFSDSAGVPCHTGIVVDFDETSVYTVEGNTSGASGVVANGGGVAAKVYSRTDRLIHGYGYPNYALCPEAEEPTRQELVELIDQGIRAALTGDSPELTALLDARIRAVLLGRDTQPSAWAAEELQQAVAAGITDGTRPQGYATRQEVAAMVYRATGA